MIGREEGMVQVPLLLVFGSLGQEITKEMRMYLGFGKR